MKEFIVTERCKLEDGEVGIRIYCYSAKCADDIMNDFDIDNVYFCNDNFEGDCLDSEIISIREVK